MNREVIIRMAALAGFEIDCCSLEWHDRIERFAALVAEQEREACARLCEEVDGRLTHYRAPNCAAAIRARGQK